jgi:ribonuclease D
LDSFCRSLDGAATIALDTEFISERSYRPQLCLIQIAAAGKLAIVDPLAVDDLTPFWQRLMSPGRRTLVHAGREELNFCLRATGARPADMIDLQIAAGLCTTDYPSSYSSLVSRFAGTTLHKHETRTDWSHRPLSPRQLRYAIDDVIHLEPMWETISTRLAELGRTEWLHTEMKSWQDEVQEFAESERWRRISGITTLDPRGLAVARELWRWRETEAERRDAPVRRVLRDDLIVDLARQRVADVNRLRMVRGMERGDLRAALPKLAESIRRGLAVTEEELTRFTHRGLPSQLNFVAQLLASALTSICRSAGIAVGIVGTVQDVRDLIAERLGYGEPDSVPSLAEGWRATIVGRALDDLLAGRTSMRIVDPRASDPLAFEPFPHRP